MNQQDKNQNQLLLPRNAIVGDNAFDGDLLERKKVAVDLTRSLDRLREGAVLAIDAPWGEGKTCFGRNWTKYLEDEEHKVVFIDAFEQDYVEDPFLLLVSEITEVLDNGEGSTKGLLEKAVNVGKAILPMSTKALINMSGRFFIGSANLSEDMKDIANAASDESADVTGKWIEEKINNHAQEKESLKYFKEELTKFAAEQDKPVIIIIDELDRCKPTFAVQLIERVKHFFDVPNLVFVLLLNRNQLEKAVKGVYGAETDASRYLGKFVNFFFMLPKRTSVERITDDHVKDYVSGVFRRYNFENNSEHYFKGGLSDIATIFNMSLRDIEQSIALYAFAQPSREYEYEYYLPYTIALKIMNPELFQRLNKDSSSEAHKKAQEYIATTKEQNQTSQTVQKHLDLLLKWHEDHIISFKDKKKLPLSFSHFAKQIDLSI